MKKVYFEQRIAAARGTASQAADLMRHLHTRQYLGRAVIVCDQPVAMLSALRKQWLKLSRTLQYRRSETLNVDKILKYTHTITRMQRMNFTGKTTLDWATADIYCLRPDDALILPDDCYTVYITTPPTIDLSHALHGQVTDGGLIVDYNHATAWQEYRCLPKAALEQAVSNKWLSVETFFTKHHINVNDLFTGNAHNIPQMDDALDTLLASSKAFMPLADSFHRTLALARPLKITKNVRMKYDALSLLAHRVQALSPGEYSQRFLETYNEDDSMFLYDSELAAGLSHEQLGQAITYRINTGHLNIARAYSALQGQQENLQAFIDMAKTI
jgi:hypothetical protein